MGGWPAAVIAQVTIAVDATVNRRAQTARAPAEPVTFRVGDVQDGAMTFDDLRAAIDRGTPLPADAPVLVRALWHDATGDWEGAHRVAQDVETAEGAWVHAYLHRKEGDTGN